MFCAATHAASRICQTLATFYEEALNRISVQSQVESQYSRVSYKGDREHRERKQGRQDAGNFSEREQGHPVAGNSILCFRVLGGSLALQLATQGGKGTLGLAALYATCPAHPLSPWTNLSPIAIGDGGICGPNEEFHDGFNAQDTAWTPICVEWSPIPRRSRAPDGC